MKFSKDYIFLGLIVLFNILIIVDGFDKDKISTFLFLTYFNVLFSIAYTIKGDSK